MCIHRTFFDVLPPTLVTFSDFFRHFKSLDTARSDYRMCLTFIAELAFSSKESAVSASDSAAPPRLPIPPQSLSAVILIGVDEISKSECEHKLLKLLGRISDSPLLLSNGQRVAVLPIVTSLSQSLLAKLATLSNRPLSLIPMPVYLPGASDVLMQNLQLEQEYRPTIDALCRSLGNHGRSLEVLHDLLSPVSVHKNAFAMRMDLLNDKESAIDRILNAVADDDKGASSFQVLTDDAKSLVMPVCHALLGSTLGRSKKLKNCPKTLDQLQMHGVFIGDATSKRGKITPIMSPFQVRLWADTILEENIDSELNLLATKLIEVLTLQPPISGTDFERFHAGTLCESVSFFLFFC